MQGKQQEVRQQMQDKECDIQCMGGKKTMIETHFLIYWTKTNIPMIIVSSGVQVHSVQQSLQQGLSSSRGEVVWKEDDQREIQGTCLRRCCILSCLHQ